MAEAFKKISVTENECIANNPEGRRPAGENIQTRESSLLLTDAEMQFSSTDAPRCSFLTFSFYTSATGHRDPCLLFDLSPAIRYKPNYYISPLISTQDSSPRSAQFSSANRIFGPRGKTIILGLRWQIHRSLRINTVSCDRVAFYECKSNRGRPGTRDCLFDNDISLPARPL